MGGSSSYSLRTGWISVSSLWAIMNCLSLFFLEVYLSFKCHFCYSWFCYHYFYNILILFGFINFSSVLPRSLCGREWLSNHILLCCWLGLNYNSMILSIFMNYNSEEKIILLFVSTLLSIVFYCIQNLSFLTTNTICIISFVSIIVIVLNVC